MFTILSLITKYVDVSIKIFAISNFSFVVFYILHLVVFFVKSTKIFVINEFDVDFRNFIDDNVKIIRNKLTEINVSNLTHECKYLMINSIYIVLFSNSNFRYVFTRFARNVFVITFFIKRFLSTSFRSFREILVIMIFRVTVGKGNEKRIPSLLTCEKGRILLFSSHM